MMKRNLTIGVLILAMLLLSLGLIFLCAAARQPSRYVLGFVLLALGVTLALWSGMRLQRLLSLDPEHLSDRITALAREGGANEVTLSQVVAELGVPDEAARAALDLLVQKGQCRPERRGERGFYVFPGLEPSKAVRRCAYCGTEFPVREPIRACPHCGGEVHLVRE